MYLTHWLIQWSSVSVTRAERGKSMETPPVELGKKLKPLWDENICQDAGLDIYTQLACSAIPLIHFSWKKTPLFQAISENADAHHGT